MTQPGSRAANALVETVDLYPTLCKLAGLPKPTVPQILDGQSLTPVLRDPQLAFRDHLFHVYPRGARIGRAVRTLRHRMVEWKVPGAAPETADIELYDYETDPLETTNLAEQNPEIVTRLRSMLARQPEAKPQVRRRPRSETP